MNSSIQEQVIVELIRTALSLLITLFTLGLGWLIGNRVSTNWAIKQKRREIDLAIVNDFYKAYGEFFAVWKLWIYFKGRDFPDGNHWELLERSAAAEGIMESIYVKLSSERKLSDREIEVLGRFRQGFQTLRERIRDGQFLGWAEDKHDEYVSFKRLAGLVSHIILEENPQRGHTFIQADDALMQITSQRWQNSWVLSNESWNRLRVK